MCGALDMIGGVEEWLATLKSEPDALRAVQDVPAAHLVLLSYHYNDKDHAEDIALCCGVRMGMHPQERRQYTGFRVVWVSRGED
jgi:formylglycine-generating enzyme required for sulfatase activity